MKSFKDSIEANNQAVALLGIDQDRNAMVLLRSTLSDVRDLFFAMEQEQANASFSNSTEHLQGIEDIENILNLSLSSISTDSDDNQHIKSPSSVSHDQVTTLLSVRLPRQSLCSSSSSQAEVYLQIYDSAFLLEKEETDGYVITSTILWNMALANHRRGIRLSLCSFLERALQMYKISLHLLSKSDNGYLYSILILGIYNNMAQVYSQLFHVGELVECIECLRKAIAKLEFDEENEDHTFFFLNVVFYLERELTLAPAA